MRKGDVPRQQDWRPLHSHYLYFYVISGRLYILIFGQNVLCMQSIFCMVNVPLSSLLCLLALFTFRSQILHLRFCSVVCWFVLSCLVFPFLLVDVQNCLLDPASYRVNCYCFGYVVFCSCSCSLTSFGCCCFFETTWKYKMSSRKCKLCNMEWVLNFQCVAVVLKNSPLFGVRWKWCFGKEQHKHTCQSSLKDQRMAMLESRASEHIALPLYIRDLIWKTGPHKINY